MSFHTTFYRTNQLFTLKMKIFKVVFYQVTGSDNLTCKDFHLIHHLLKQSFLYLNFSTIFSFYLLACVRIMTGTAVFSLCKLS